MYSNIAFANSTLVNHRRRSSSSICIDDQNDSIIALSSTPSTKHASPGRTNDESPTDGDFVKAANVVLSALDRHPEFGGRGAEILGTIKDRDD